MNNNVMMKSYQTESCLTSWLSRVGIIVAITLLLPSMAQAQTQKVSLTGKNITLQNAFSQIERQTGVSFNYESGTLNTSLVIQNPPVAKNLNDLIAALLRGTGCSFIFKDKSVLITRSVAKNSTKTITGTVTDSKGEAVVGANVSVKGTATGTITDMDGNFSLNAGQGEILLVSYVGFTSKEIPVTGKSIYDISLNEDTQALDEVVVVGYGTTKRADLTGAITSLAPRDFKDQPAVSASQILQGRSAGVSVKNNIGAPGVEPMIRIRGVNSINGENNPLVVVDGNYSSLNAVHPADIESMEILKDASATAIYGSRGANGVIIIKTKSAGEGENTRVHVAANVGIKNVARKYDVMNSYDYATYNNSLGLTGYTDSEMTRYQQGEGTNWQDQVYRTGVSQDYQASIAGNSKKTRFYISAQYAKEGGLIKNTDWDRYSFRGNLETDVSNRVTIGIQAAASRDYAYNRRLGKGGDKTNNPVMHSALWSPTEPIYMEDGITYNATDRWGINIPRSNPLLLCMGEDNMNWGLGYSVTGNLKVKIMDGLTFDGKATLSNSATGSRYYDSVAKNGTQANAGQSSGENNNWLLQGYLNYGKTFGQKHNISAMIGMESSYGVGNSHEGSASKLNVTSVRWYNLGLGSVQTVGSGYSNNAMMSYFVRTNYNYDSRYYITGTWRADGSSKFKGDNQFSYFPSFALGWRLSEEGFLKDTEIFQNLKLRGSWGITGSQAIGSYATFSPLAGSSRAYSFTDGVYRPGYWIGNGGNPNLQWEETTQLDVGFDLSILKGRLTIGFDYYNKNTDKLLSSKTTPQYAGGTKITVNAGQMNNYGFELSANWVAVKTKEFSYDLNFNGSINRNEIKDTGEEPVLWGEGYASGILPQSPFIITAGHPMGTLYGLTYLGIWQKGQEEEAAKFGQKPGDYRYWDKNGDHAYGSEDYDFIGNCNPSFTWGLNNHFSYKNFDLNILFEGVHGRDIMNLSYLLLTEPYDCSRTINLADARNRWSETNPNARFAKLEKGTVNTNKVQPLSSQWIEDGTFVKLRNVSLSYLLKKELTKFADIRLSVSAQNLFTLSGYKGLDPEVSSSPESDHSNGMDFFAYPNPRTVTFGIAMDF